MSLLSRRMMMTRQEEEEMEWKTLQEPTAIGEDQNRLTYEIPDAQEVMLVFYGRTNDADDSLANTNDAGTVWVNDIRTYSNYFTYVRKAGSCYHTVLRVIVQNGYIDGYVNPKGNTSIFSFSSLVTEETIKSIALVTNNLFKAESTVAIYYR